MTSTIRSEEYGRRWQWNREQERDLRPSIFTAPIPASSAGSTGSTVDMGLSSDDLRERLLLSLATCPAEMGRSRMVVAVLDIPELLPESLLIQLDDILVMGEYRVDGREGRCWWWW